VLEFRQKAEAELRSNILPFWLKHAIDDEYGGFLGQIANDLTIDPRASKGLILIARILWTFSKAYTFYHDPVYLEKTRGQEGSPAGKVEEAVSYGQSSTDSPAPSSPGR
jgi:mannobiose 2-epimerase